MKDGRGCDAGHGWRPAWLDWAPAPGAEERSPGQSDPVGTGQTGGWRVGGVGEVGNKKVDGDMQVRHSASQTQERRDEAQTLGQPSLSNEDGAFCPSILEPRGLENSPCSPGQAGDSSRPTRWILTGEIPQRVPYDRRAIIPCGNQTGPHDATGLKIASYSGTNATRRGGERPGRAMRASWTDSMKMGRPCGRGARSVRQRVEMVPGSRVRPLMGKQKMFCSCRCHCRCPGRAGLSPSAGLRRGSMMGDLAGDPVYGVHERSGERETGDGEGKRSRSNWIVRESSRS